MSQSSATAVQTVATVCDSSVEAVFTACKVMGYRTLGGLILRRAYELDSLFCAEVRIAEAALRAQKQRREGHHEKAGHPQSAAEQGASSL
jgi:hypothetical protein